MKHRPIFITGIDTGVGKTICSAVLVEKLRADYWKPVQSGDLDFTDTDRVRNLVSNRSSIFHPEAYRLTQPFSPHKSAALDNIRIDLEHIIPPSVTNQLVIEGAGGLMVPLNDSDLMIDLIERFNADAVLVSRNYLGSINHTLMSLALLKSRNIPVRALVFCGEPDDSTEQIISRHTGATVLRIPFFTDPDKTVISKFSESLIW